VRTDSLFRVLYVVYCLEAGIFLVVAPWTESWQRVAMLVPYGVLRSLLSLTWLRGMITGFGLVHLVWAAHDIDLVLRGATAHGGAARSARHQ
jgi:hypothetical protein